MLEQSLQAPQSGLTSVSLESGFRWFSRPQNPLRRAESCSCLSPRLTQSPPQHPHRASHIPSAGSYLWCRIGSWGHHSWARWPRPPRALSGAHTATCSSPPRLGGSPIPRQGSSPSHPSPRQCQAQQDLVQGSGRARESGEDEGPLSVTSCWLAGQLPFLTLWMQTAAPGCVLKMCPRTAKAACNWWFSHCPWRTHCLPGKLLPYPSPSDAKQPSRPRCHGQALNLNSWGQLSTPSALGASHTSLNWTFTL